jgi:multidrug efflux pump subunit AcrB
VAFVEGIAGQIFGDLALTVTFSLLASLFVALFFDPLIVSKTHFEFGNRQNIFFPIRTFLYYRNVRHRRF